MSDVDMQQLAADTQDAVSELFSTRINMYHMMYPMAEATSPDLCYIHSLFWSVCIAIVLAERSGLCVSCRSVSASAECICKSHC